MKKIFFAIMILGAVLSKNASAQSDSHTAILHSDGKQETLQSEAASGNASASTTSAVAQHKFIHHEAVLLPNGDQEMRLTDTQGKITVISASKTENLQKKYWDYLQKNNLPCACSSSNDEATPTPTVVTRPQQEQVDGLKK